MFSFKKISLFVFICILFNTNILNSKDNDFYYLKVIVSAYCPCKKCCGKWSDGKTKLNTDAYKAGAAVDPKVIPLKSHIDIPGYNRGPNKNGSWILCDDTGNKIKGNKIDIRFKTHQEAINWGIKELKIRVHPAK